MSPGCLGRFVLGLAVLVCLQVLPILGIQPALAQPEGMADPAVPVASNAASTGEESFGKCLRAIQFGEAERLMQLWQQQPPDPQPPCDADGFFDRVHSAPQIDCK